MRFPVAGLLLVSIGSAFVTACVKDEPFHPAPPPPEVETPLPPEPERSKVELDPASSYTLVGAQSGKCVQFSGPDDGARAQLATCSGSPVQSFRLEVIPDGYRHVRNVASGKCLDVANAAKTDGAPVIQWTCGAGPNQHWIIADAAGDTLRLWARHSGKVLDVVEEKTVDGTPLSQWTWKNSANQQFRFKRVEPTLASAAAGGDKGAAGGSSGSAQGLKTKAAAHPPKAAAPTKGSNPPSAEKDGAVKRPAATPTP